MFVKNLDNMDNDIIERAREYADRHKETEINYFGIDKVYGYSRIYNAEITAYERGAKEQKAIDEVNYKQGYHDASEKFREWLKNNWREYVYQDRDGIIHFGHWETDFHKVMGE